jgi:formylglycine-generating enzyme required for sulfatase activity
VKQKTPPNGWGLYDMAGDVSEWCHDQYKDQLGTSLETDPVGINPTLQRVIRGGSFFSRANKLRAASRSSMSEGSRSREIGFRCVRRL